MTDAGESPRAESVRLDKHGPIWRRCGTSPGNRADRCGDWANEQSRKRI